MVLDAMILLSWKIGRFDLTYGLLYSLVPLIALLVISGVWQRSWTIIKPILVIVILIFLFQTFLISGGKVLFHAGPFMVRLQGLQSGVSLSTFILNVSLIFIWLFQTTEVKEFTFAFEQLGLNRKAVYLFSASLQNIEVIEQRAKRIQEAQEARGIKTRGNFFIRVKALVSLIVPLMLTSVINSADMSLALEARCFDSPHSRTHLVTVKRQPYENVFLVVNILICIALLVGRCM